MPSTLDFGGTLKEMQGLSTLRRPAVRPIMTRVLVIDDNDDFRKLALRWFHIHGIEAEGASNGATGLEVQRARPATVIVTDIFMPEKDGVETIRDLCTSFPGPRSSRGDRSRIADRLRCIRTRARRGEDFQETLQGRPARGSQ